MRPIDSYLRQISALLAEGRTAMMVPALLPLTKSDNKNSAKAWDEFGNDKICGGTEEREAEDNDKITESRKYHVTVHT